MTEAKNGSGNNGVKKCQSILGKMTDLTDKKNAKNKNNFVCKICAFICLKKSDYERHLLTAKHKRLTETDGKNAEKRHSKNTYKCHCGKEYMQRQSLHKHKKKCNYDPNQPIADTKTHSDTPELESCNNATMMAILHETTELRNLVKEQQEQLKQQQEEHNKQIQELIPQLQQVTNINNCNNTTTTNNRFNLNFFLNEQCKDAISIQNFIENLNIGIPELEHMGDVGYVKGMMSIFSNTLGAMDIYKRPLHCTDLKRETVYIKQGDTWKKDTDDKTELKKLIKTVEYKNYKSLRLWEREHPEAFECDTQDDIDYMRISNESLGGFDSTDAIKLGKIMKHVVREVYIK